jgi:hypothetical protein
MTRSEAHQLVDYTFDRPVGELHQEVGGVMVTLAALCLASNANMHESGETELARIWTKIEKIRAKQAAKPKHSPLPEVVIADTAGAKPLSAEHVTIRRDLLQDLIDDVSDYAVSREFKQRESQWRTQLLESARAALATPAPLSDEPVAWIDKRLLALLPKYYVDVILAGHKVSTDHVPLYAAPQAECAPREAQPVAIEKTVRALELILGSLEFEQHMYANADPRRSTIDFPRAIQIAKSAIQADKGEANGTV